VCPHDQGDTLRGNGEFFTDRPNGFARLCFQPDLVSRKAENGGNTLPHLVAIRKDFRPLSKNNTVEIHDLPVSIRQSLGGSVEHFSGVASAVCGVSVWEEFANVTEGRSPKHCIGNSVQKHIGIAVADGAAGVLQGQAAEDQRSPRFEAVSVVAKADTEG